MFSIGLYLIVDLVPAHSDGVHDELPPMVVRGSAGRQVVGVMLRAKVMPQLVGGDQVRLLGRGAHTQTHTHEGIIAYHLTVL